MTTLDMGDAAAGGFLAVSSNGTDLQPVASLIDGSRTASVSATVVEDCEDTTGWTQTGGQDALSASATYKTQGSFAIRTNLRASSTESVARTYHAFSSPLDPAGRAYLACDVLYAIEGGGGLESPSDYFVLEVNDGATFAGTASQLQIPPISEAAWSTMLVPVGDLDSVASFGIRRTVATSSTGVRVAWYLDNIRWPTETEIEAAVIANPGAAVVVPATFTPTGTPNAGTLPDATVLDLRPDYTRLSREGGTYHFRDFNIPEDGSTDCTNAIIGAIDGTPDHGTLIATPGMAYRVDSNIVVRNKRGVTVDFQRARLFATSARYADETAKDLPFVSVRDSEDITLRRMRIFGYRNDDTNGADMTATASELLSEANRGVETIDNTWSNSWSGITNCGVIRSDRGSEIGLVGLNSVRMDPTAAGDCAFGTASGTSGIRVKPSTSYTFSTLTRPAAGGTARNIRIDAAWYDSGGSLLSTSTGSNVAQTSDVVAKTVTQAHTSHASAAYVRFIVNVLSVATGTEYHYFDSFSLKLTTATTKVTVSTTATLSAQHAELRIPLGNGDSDQQYFGRDKDGYVKAGFTLSDSAQVANDCQLMVFDNDTGEIMATSTLTLTGTPTLYTLSFLLREHQLRMKLRWVVRKMLPTTNTITVTSCTEYNRNTYSGEIEEQHGVRADHRCRNLNVIDCEIEGVGGDAVSGSALTVSGVLVRGGYSRCAQRQGYSFNGGANIRIEDVNIWQPGRSGLDFEPFASDGSTSNVHIRNVKIWDAYNYDIAAGNWARNYEWHFDNIVGYESRLGFLFGGCRYGIIQNCQRVVAEANWHTSSLDADWTVRGYHMTLMNCVSVSGFNLSGTDTNTFDPGPTSDTYTSAGIVGYGLRVLSPYGRVVVGANCYAEAIYTQAERTFAYGNSQYVSPVKVDGVLGRWEPGELRRQLPNSFKGVVLSSDPWFPGGLDLRNDPAVRVRGIGSGTAKRNNLRGRATPSNGAEDVTVAFPTRTWANTTSGQSVTAQNHASGAMAEATYYYRIASRDRYGGPVVPNTQLSVAVAAPNDSVRIRPGLTADLTNDIAHTHFTVYRGTASGGPYTHRVEITPTSNFPGIAYNTNVNWSDIGTTLVIPAADDDQWGYATSYTWTAGTYTPADETGYEPDTNYDVWVSTSWETTTAVTSKTTAGFTVTFGTAAPTGAETVSWLLVGF